MHPWQYELLTGHEITEYLRYVQMVRDEQRAQREAMEAMRW